MSVTLQLADNQHLLVGIDPGEVYNGVGVLICTEGPKGFEKLLMGFRPETDALADIIERWSVVGQRLHICMEDFILYPDDMRRKNSTEASNKTRAQRWNKMKTTRSIGIIEHYVRKLKLPFHVCRAADHKGTVTEAYMRAAGLWGEYNYKDGGHIRDATSIADYQFRIRGILNGNKRVITPTDLKLLAF